MPLCSGIVIIVNLLPNLYQLNCRMLVTCFKLKFLSFLDSNLTIVTDIYK